MKDWIPHPKPDLVFSELPLDVEEGFLLSRIDGSTTVDELGHLTGLTAERVVSILGRLMRHGALLTDDPEPPDDGQAASDEEEAMPDQGEGEDAFALDEEPSEEGSEARGWRQAFESDFRPLAVDARIEKARLASGDALCALCHDPAPQVVVALLENPQVSLLHARLIAQHHRVGSGLDEIGRRPKLLRDPKVQRNLFRNPQCSERLLRKILGRQRLHDVYRLSLSRELNERVRTLVREEFRHKFTKSTAEERVSLLLKSQGRCLSLLTGIALGSKASSLLCQRTLHSTMLIQNLARWSSTPPAVVAHLARQAAVKRSSSLKNLILRHPNASSQLKHR